MEKLEGKQTYVLGVGDAEVNDQVKNVKNLTRLELKKAVIKSLESEHYKFIRNLGKGSMGDVLVMSKEGSHREVAVKIVKEEDVAESEVFVWPRLHHKNIQSLQEILFVDEYEAFAFIMPIQKTSLLYKVCDKEFMEKTFALDVLKSWFVDILRGINYLHMHGLCHLDIKTDNILIADDGSALVCDFSYLDEIKIPVERYGIPSEYCPPEACPRYDNLGNEVPIFGVAADMWCFGVIVVDSLTNFVFTKKCEENPQKFSSDVYPVMFSILQMDNFKSHVKTAMPSVMLKKKIVRLMRNFIMMFFRLDPDSRPSAEKALTHKFLEQGSYKCPKDALWRKQVKASEIDSFVSDYHRSLLNREFSNDSLKRLVATSSDASVNIISKTETDLQCEKAFKQGKGSICRKNEIPIIPKTYIVQKAEKVAVLNYTEEKFVTTAMVSDEERNQDLNDSTEHEAISKEQSPGASPKFIMFRHHSMPILPLPLQSHTQAFKKKYKSMNDISVKTSAMTASLKSKYMLLDYAKVNLVNSSSVDRSSLNEIYVETNIEMKKNFDNACEHHENLRRDKQSTVKDVDIQKEHCVVSEEKGVLSNESNISSNAISGAAACVSEIKSKDDWFYDEKLHLSGPEFSAVEEQFRKTVLSYGTKGSALNSNGLPSKEKEVVCAGGASESDDPLIKTVSGRASEPDNPNKLTNDVVKNDISPCGKVTVENEEREYADEKQSLVKDESTNEKDEAQEEATFECFISERLDKTGNCSKDGYDDPPDEGNDRSEVICTPMTPMTEDEPAKDQRRAGLVNRLRGWFRKKWAKVRRSS